MSEGKILFIFSSATKTLDGKPIGSYLPEAAHPYYVLKENYIIEGASPAGGEITLDQDSVKNFTDAESVSFHKEDKSAIKVWKETKKISEVNADDYVALHVVGGHGPMFDLATDKTFAKLVEEFLAKKKIVAAVCHGPAALLSAKTPEGKSILDGIPVTGFSNSEEAQTPYNDFVNTLPFSLEDRLNEASGGKYQQGKDWSSFFVYGNGVLTGQNPQSAGPYAKRLAEILAQ